MKEQFIISTDLDGTLLDHNDYSWAAAKPALELCRERAVPVVLNTSKTSAEVVDLQRELALVSPLIVENGSALIIPSNLLRQSIDHPTTDSSVSDHTELTFGATRLEILQFINQVREEEGWEFEGFNDWSVAAIANNTGLSLEAAARAADKKYSEPFVWNDCEESFLEFQGRVLAAGFKVLQGGRFYHLQGKTDKAQPLLWLKAHADLLFENTNGKSTPKLVCLGDNHNDVDMLNIADYPVCVRSPVADFPSLNTDKAIFYTDSLGPFGWNEAIQSILGELTNRTVNQ